MKKIRFIIILVTTINIALSVLFAIFYSKLINGLSNLGKDIAEIWKESGILNPDEIDKIEQSFTIPWYNYLITILCFIFSLALLDGIIIGTFVLCNKGYGLIVSINLFLISVAIIACILINVVWKKDDFTEMIKIAHMTISNKLVL